MGRTFHKGDRSAGLQFQCVHYIWSEILQTGYRGKHGTCLHAGKAGDTDCAGESRHFKDVKGDPLGGRERKAWDLHKVWGHSQLCWGKPDRPPWRYRKEAAHRTQQKRPGCIGHAPLHQKRAVRDRWTLKRTFRDDLKDHGRKSGYDYAGFYPFAEGTADHAGTSYGGLFWNVWARQTAHAWHLWAYELLSARKRCACGNDISVGPWIYSGAARLLRTNVKQYGRCFRPWLSDRVFISAFHDHDAFKPFFRGDHHLEFQRIPVCGDRWCVQHRKQYHAAEKEPGYRWACQGKDRPCLWRTGFFAYHDEGNPACVQ